MINSACCAARGLRGRGKGRSDRVRMIYAISRTIGRSLRHTVRSLQRERQRALNLNKKIVLYRSGRLNEVLEGSYVSKRQTNHNFYGCLSLQVTRQHCYHLVQRIMMKHVSENRSVLYSIHKFLSETVPNGKHT
jgi:hypothetical protein